MKTFYRRNIKNHGLKPSRHFLALDHKICIGKPCVRTFLSKGAANLGRNSKGNIFAASTALANEYASVNLGQGFPSFPMENFVKECAIEAITHDHNQYSRPGGHPVFVETISEIYSPLYKRKLNPLTEIVSCNGAQEGIFNILTTFCDATDEIVCIEPFFDVYKKCAEMVGTTVKGVPLRLSKSKSSSSDFQLDISELSCMISEKTKLLFLNTPHNPTGKVFELAELEAIASVVRKHPQLIVVSDEVYEFMTFDGLKHERFALLDGMFERTISLFSAGKTFSCTGWRVGYCIGPEKYVLPLISSQGVIAFCSATPLEFAIANAFKLAKTRDYFSKLASKLEKKRDKLSAALSSAGMNPIIPQGGYFLMADTSSIMIDESMTNAEDPRDVRVNEYLTKTIGVTGIPTSGFYSPHNTHLSDNMLRYAYCKTDEEIEAAAKRLLQK